MQATDRRLLQLQIEPLARAIGSYETIKELLIISKTFNRVMIEHIESAKVDNFSKNVLLISDLQTRGPKAFRTFVEILELTGCIEALKIISPQSLRASSNNRKTTENNNNNNSAKKLKSYPLGMFSYNFANDNSQQAEPQQEDTQGTDKQSIGAGNHNGDGDKTNLNEGEINCSKNNASSMQQMWHQQQKQQTNRQQQMGLFHWHPYQASSLSPSTPVKVQPSSNGVSKSMRDDTDRDKNNKITTATTTTTSGSMTIGSRRAPKAMTMKNSVMCHNDETEDYKMTAKPRGMCLIVNNMKFDCDILAERKGSDIDSDRFATIFKQLWFEVYHELNLTASEMEDTIDKFASMCSSNHDAVVVIILSHGSDRGLYGSDGLEMDPADVFGRFDNERCKSMMGKPKIFILQACRGTNTDYGELGEVALEDDEDGEDATLDCTKNRPPLFTRSIEFSNGGGSNATQTDMLICYSCLPGYVSVRNEVTGSWLGTALGYYLLTCAWEKDFEQILAMVSRDFEGKVSSHGHKQAIEIKYLGWRKRLFFNPGIYQ